MKKLLLFVFILSSVAVSVQAMCDPSVENCRANLGEFQMGSCSLGDRGYPYCY